MLLIGVFKKHLDCNAHDIACNAHATRGYCKKKNTILQKILFRSFANIKIFLKIAFKIKTDKVRLYYLHL